LTVATPQLDVTIAPNPAGNTCTLSQLPVGGQLQIFDATGRLMMEQSSIQSVIQVPVSDWPLGMYQVAVRKEQQHWSGTFQKI
jgi:Secretion system C-terminal sorting domain